ncbi:4'-phosphopantetheinyl transferase family protein [Paenibacillus zanthoxyli]|uniref:4'-phosphopantetheinyl transferase family protein n=1 Tax=Paenibacillus zanthoxyli TaxID=369399 RepID=UPI00046E9656|nr:4'-phosphopantetheinyl transferase superfamily protein [Paenibacillus zanthoxyli]
MEIIALRIPEFIEQEDLELLMTKVSEEKKEKLLKYRRSEDLYRSLLGELLVRVTACQYIGCKNGALRFVFNHYGKPSLADDPGFSFNLSHSGNWVVIIWDQRQQALGVDVEEIKPVHMEIAERFFAETEYRDLMMKQGKDRLEYFFRLWTLKESYVKAMGKGLSIPFNDFSLVQKGDNEWFSPEARRFHFKSFKADDRHSLSACAETEDIPDQFKLMPFPALCRMLEEM